MYDVLYLYKDQSYSQVAIENIKINYTIIFLFLTCHRSVETVLQTGFIKIINRLMQLQKLQKLQEGSDELRTLFLVNIFLR